MALSSFCLFRSSPVKMDGSRLPSYISCKNYKTPTQTVAANLSNHRVKWYFSGQSTTFGGSNVGRNLAIRKESGSAINASWLPCSQIASSAFTWGTAAVLPFYTFMIAVPQAELTKKLMTSSVPFALLGSLYAFLLYLSWSPDTLRLMFASKYLLPELPGIATLFSGEMTLASAWIHLLAVDLFAARQVYLEGLREGVETRHSVILCLMFCPIGILAHVITKAVVTKREKTKHGIH